MLCHKSQCWDFKPSWTKTLAKGQFLIDTFEKKVIKCKTCHNTYTTPQSMSIIGLSRVKSLWSLWAISLEGHELLKCGLFEVSCVGYINKSLVLIDRLWQVSTWGGPNSFSQSNGFACISWWLSLRLFKVASRKWCGCCIQGIVEAKLTSWEELGCQSQRWWTEKKLVFFPSLENSRLFRIQTTVMHTG